MQPYVIFVIADGSERCFHISSDDVESELRKIAASNPNHKVLQSQYAHSSKRLISIAKVRCVGTKPSQLKRVVARTTALNVMLKAA